MTHVETSSAASQCQLTLFFFAIAVLNAACGRDPALGRSAAERAELPSRALAANSSLPVSDSVDGSSHNEARQFSSNLELSYDLSIKSRVRDSAAAIVLLLLHDTLVRVSASPRGKSISLWFTSRELERECSAILRYSPRKRAVVKSRIFS